MFPANSLSKRRQIRLWLTGLVASRYDGLYHFDVVDPGGLMRCGQARVRELEQIWSRFGLKTIVCARGGTRHPLRGRWFGKEKAWCSRRGVNFIHMPFSDSKAPPIDCFRRFAEIARNRAAHPILVHCEQGIHRSGILSAVYRLEVMNWPIERALRELGRRGFDPDDLKRRTLIDTLKIWHDETSKSADAES